MKDICNNRQRFVRGLLIGWGVAAAALIAGCGQPNSWTKPGITEATFDSDMATCRHQVATGTQSIQPDDSGGLERSDLRDRLVRRCMEAKGYSLKQ